MSDKPMIFADSPESATLMTITGWVSRNGQFFGDNEVLARNVGATHRRCEKHGPFPVNAYCRQCSDERQAATFNAMPEVTWDGDSPLFSFRGEFFYDREALADHVADQENPAEYLADMQLVVAVPQYATEVDPVDLYQDLLPEDIDEVPPAIQKAFDALNAAIREHKEPLSWTEGKQRAIVTLEQLGIAAGEGLQP